jgi:hypothetical protein
VTFYIISNAQYNKQAHFIRRLYSIDGEKYGKTQTQAQNRQQKAPPEMENPPQN